MKEKDFISLIELIKHTLDELEINPEQSALIIVYPTYITSDDLSEIKTGIFNYLKINIIAFISQIDAILAKMKIKSGLIIDIGMFSSRISTIFEYDHKKEANFILHVGGQHITRYLIEVILTKFQYKSKFPLIESVEIIKKEAVRNSLDLEEIYKKISNGSNDFDYSINLPDGNHLVLKKERYKASEIFFNPQIAHIHSENIINLVEKSLNCWKKENWNKILQNIIIYGNGGKIEKLDVRIQSEINLKFPEISEIKCLKIPNRKSLAWEGASIIFLEANDKITWISQVGEG